MRLVFLLEKSQQKYVIKIWEDMIVYRKNVNKEREFVMSRHVRALSETYCCIAVMSNTSESIFFFENVMNRMLCTDLIMDYPQDVPRLIKG
jgi:hypothetical protein